MSEIEYRLLDITDGISEQDNIKLNNQIESLMQPFNQATSSEALLFNNFLLLPNRPELQKPSSIKIFSTNKRKIDYISEIQIPEVQDALKHLQVANDLNQKEVQMIVKKLNKFQKQLSDETNMLEDLLKFVESYTDSVLNEKQVKKYVRDIEQHSKKLINSIYIENPEVLTKEIKDEVLNKVTILREHLDCFIRDFSNSPASE